MQAVVDLRKTCTYARRAHARTRAHTRAHTRAGTHAHTHARTHRDAESAGQRELGENGVLVAPVPNVPESLLSQTRPSCSYPKRVLVAPIPNLSESLLSRTRLSRSYPKLVRVAPIPTASAAWTLAPHTKVRMCVCVRARVCAGALGRAYRRGGTSGSCILSQGIGEGGGAGAGSGVCVCVCVCARARVQEGFTTELDVCLRAGRAWTPEPDSSTGYLGRRANAPCPRALDCI